MIRRKYIFVTAFWAILYFDPYLFQAPVLVQKYKKIVFNLVTTLY